nr:HAMP domain-containing sensor histidine kinase [Novosphingobium taihuense]
MRALFSSTIARLGAAIFLFQLVSSGAAIYLLRAQVQDLVHEDRTRQVLDVRDDLLATYYEGGADALRNFVSRREGSVADPLIFVALSGKGAPLLSNVEVLPRSISAKRPEPVTVTSATGLPASEALAMRTTLPDGSTLVVGASTATERGLDLAFAEAIGLTIALTIGLALVSAILLGTLISRRTHAIATTAEALASGNFAARVADGHAGDGFDHLRRQMNLMAERIDELVRQMQSVAGTLAHDLQSPVARLRASIETAMAADIGSEAEIALSMARTDAEALQDMLSAALELSRLESGAIIDRRQPMDLGEVTADLAELYEPLAEQSGIALTWDVVPLRAQIDRELMSRALANLIDNAIKYGGDKIHVSCRGEGDIAVVSVADNGPGIAESDRDRAIDRFTRLDNARTRPGAGLGLAMVAAVARIHDGRLELSGAAAEHGGGLVSSIRIPLG